MGGCTLLDVGGYVGDTALYYAKKGCKVYSLEPNPLFYKRMIRNIALNPDLKNRITPIMAALGTDIDSDSYRGNGKSYTIESLLHEFGLKNIDYLKVDIKPNEKQISVADFKKVRRALAIEYANPDEYGRKELINKIKMAGFKRISCFQHSTDKGATIERVGIVVAYRR